MRGKGCASDSSTMERLATNETTADGAAKCAQGLGWGLAGQYAAAWLVWAAPLPMAGMSESLALWIPALVFGLAGFVLVFWYGAKLAGRLQAEKGRRPIWPSWLWGALAGWLGFWGVAAAFPAARRRQNRPAARAALSGGLLWFASGVTMRCATVPSFPLWAWWTGMVVAAHSAGAWLLWWSLWRLGGKTKALRLAGWAMAAATLLGFALLPCWRTGSLSRKADAAVAAIDQAAGWGGAGPLANARPAVAEADDPVAALDPEALAAEQAEWEEFFKRFTVRGNREQLDETGCAELEAWVASHRVFTAAAEAIATPGYRSCLAGAESPDDLSVMKSGCLEPRLADIGKPFGLAMFFLLRARATCERGDIASALADIRRLDALAELWGREVPSIGKVVGRVISGFTAGVLSERLDLWDDASLDEVAALAEARARKTAGLWPAAVAGDVAEFEATFRDLACSAESTEELLQEASPVRGLPRGAEIASALRFPGWLAHWEALERAAHAEYSLRAMEMGQAALALPAGPERAAAVDAMAEELEASGEKLPMVSLLLTVDWTGVLDGLCFQAEHTASLVRCAVAVKRWRRAHDGALPESLAALVPEGLAAVPPDPRTGKPPLYEPAEDGKSFLLGYPGPKGKRKPTRFFCAAPASAASAAEE